MIMRRSSKRKVESEETCYMCDKPSVTREHAPPLAFFPSDLRGNLITVPSCTAHNNDNSKDVEYVRNIVVTDINTNELARYMFRSKVLPSFRRSPKLKRQTFARYREVFVWGMNSAVVDTDPISTRQGNESDSLRSVLSRLWREVRLPLECARCDHGSVFQCIEHDDVANERAVQERPYH